jgi:hypothetical protein
MKTFALVALTLAQTTLAAQTYDVTCTGKSPTSKRSYTLQLKRQGEDLAAQVTRNAKKLFEGTLKAYKEALLIDENGKKYTKTWYWDPIKETAQVVLIDESLTRASLADPEVIEPMECRKNPR